MKNKRLESIIAWKNAVEGDYKIEIREHGNCILMTRDGYIIEELLITKDEEAYLWDEGLVEENDYEGN